MKYLQSINNNSDTLSYKLSVVISHIHRRAHPKVCLKLDESRIMHNKIYKQLYSAVWKKSCRHSDKLK